MISVANIQMFFLKTKYINKFVKGDGFEPPSRSPNEIAKIIAVNFLTTESINAFVS